MWVRVSVRWVMLPMTRENGLFRVGGHPGMGMVAVRKVFERAPECKPKQRDKSVGFSLKIWSEMAWKKRAGVAHDAHPLGAVSIFTGRCSPGLAKITATYRAS
ncbi:hypothetical protein APED_26200 [Acanthopleuribacter pedis]